MNWSNEQVFSPHNIVATQVCRFRPRNVSSILPSSHLPLKRSFSNTNTTFPSFKCFTVCVHLGLVHNVGKYSSSHRDQSLAINACMHLSPSLVGIEGLCIHFIQGEPSPSCSYTKWVNRASFGWADREVRDLELTKLSTQAKALINSLSVTSLVPKTAYNAFFAAFTRHPITSSKCGALERLRIHLILAESSLYRAVSLVFSVH